LGQFCPKIPGLKREHPVIAQAEINDRTAQNRNTVRGEQRHARLINQNAHQRKIPQHRNQSIGKMKPD
jgi:hypothetical protein